MTDTLTSNPQFRATELLWYVLGLTSPVTKVRSRRCLLGTRSDWELFEILGLAERV
jgi:hypothetical protein